MGDQLIINAHDFGIRFSTSRCPLSFGHAVYVSYHISIHNVYAGKVNLFFRIMSQDLCTKKKSIITELCSILCKSTSYKFLSSTMLQILSSEMV